MIEQPPLLSSHLAILNPSANAAELGFICTLPFYVNGALLIV
jgi:hypothetical protein